MKRYMVRFAFVLCLALAAFTGESFAQASDLVSIPVTSNLGPSAWLADAGLSYRLTPHLQTSDGLHLEPADARCLSAQSQLFVSRAQVEAGATAENIAGYQAFVTEEIKLLGPVGTVIDCGNRGDKYLPQAVAARRTQKDAEREARIVSAAKKFVASYEDPIIAINELKEKNRQLQSQASKWFWGFVVAIVVAVALVILTGVIWKKRSDDRKAFENQLFDKNQEMEAELERKDRERKAQKAQDDAEIERLRELLLANNIKPDVE